MLFTPYGLMGFSKVNYNKHTYISLPWLLVISLRETRRVHTRVYIVWEYRCKSGESLRRNFSAALLRHGLLKLPPTGEFRFFRSYLTHALALLDKEHRLLRNRIKHTGRGLQNRTFFVGQRQTRNGKSGFRKKFWFPLYSSDYPRPYRDPKRVA